MVDKTECRDFKLSLMGPLVGKTIKAINYADADEGFRIEFTDGAVLEFGFSGCEGTVEVEA